MNESFYESIFNKSPYAIMVTDDQGIYTDVNQAAVELLGAPYEKIIGKKVQDFVAPMREPMAGHLWSKFQTDGRQIGTFIISRSDGTDRIIKYVALTNFIPGRHISYAFDIQELPF